jgi:ribosomal protein L29
MKIADLRNKNKGEMEELLKEEQLKLGKLMFERQSKTLKKSSDLGKTKKTIAQIKTLLP